MRVVLVAGVGSGPPSVLGVHYGYLHGGGLQAQLYGNLWQLTPLATAAGANPAHMMPIASEKASNLITIRRIASLPSLTPSHRQMASDPTRLRYGHGT